MAINQSTPSSAQKKAEALPYDISVFELFSIGVGPSSSHTVGPMRASNRFVAELIDEGLLDRVTGVHIDLYGSLAATGAGHGTMSAALKGLCGFVPETIDIAAAEAMIERNSVDGTLPLAGYPSSSYGVNAPGGEESKVYGPVVHYREIDMTLRPLTVLPRHTNGMKIAAFAGRSYCWSVPTTRLVVALSLRETRKLPAVPRSRTRPTPLGRVPSSSRWRMRLAYRLHS